VFEGKKAN